MNKLSVRIVLVVGVIVFLSSTISFLLSNMYYHRVLKQQNEDKIEVIAQKVVDFYEDHPSVPAHDYLELIGDLNYHLYIYDEKYQKMVYGEPLREEEISESVVRNVLNGERYYGVANYPGSWFVTGFFSRDLRNSVGLPMQIGEESYALFLRPNVKKQFDELQVLLALMFAGSFFLSIFLILLFSQTIVRPISMLQRAVKKIEDGDFQVALSSCRKDELGDLTRSVQQMSTSLQRLDSMRQEFVANVSHEFKSPLTSIQGFASMLRKKMITQEEVDHYSMIISKEAERLSTLSDQLLTLAALDAEAKKVTESEVNVFKQWQEVLQQFEMQWSKKEIMIELHGDQALLFGDSALLHQVWCNLLGNAIKFSEPKGKVTIQITDKKSEVEITVHNFGEWIPEENLSHVFDRFYKVDKKREATKGGTGLGLSIVKKIIVLHGGRVEVLSSRNEGTSFIVTVLKK